MDVFECLGCIAGIGIITVFGFMLFLWPIVLCNLDKVSWIDWAGWVASIGTFALMFWFTGRRT